MTGSHSPSEFRGFKSHRRCICLHVDIQSVYHRFRFSFLFRLLLFPAMVQALINEDSNV